MMKTIKLILLIICLFINSTASCKELNSDQRIDLALQIIKDHGYTKNIAILQGNNYTHKPVTIIFKDLSEVDFAYAKFYAITATADNGDLYILINNNLRNSDPKALACLILHESNHCLKDKADSLVEETQSHDLETSLYIALINDDENLQYKTNDRLILRLNRLKAIYDDAVKAYISNNTSYVNYLKIKE